MSPWDSIGKIAVAKVANAVFSFIGLIWFSQTLGVGNLGMYFLFLALVGVSELFADMGINGAVEKRISQGEPVPETVYAALPLKLLLFTLVTATVLYLSPIINPYIGVEVAYLIPVTILLKNISDLLRRSLNGDMRVEETAYMIGVEQLGWVLFGTLFAQVGTESFALIHGYIAALVIVVTIGLVKVPLAPVKPDKKRAASLFQYGKYDIISEAGWRVYNWTDVLIAGVFLSPALVGAYEIVWRLTGVTVLFGWAVRNSTFPIVSSLEADGRHEIIESVVQRSMSLSLIFVIPALFGTLVLGEEILRIFFDIRSPIVEIVFIIIMVQKLFQAIEQVTGYTLRGMNKPNLAAIATLVAVCTNIALNTMLIPRFGLVGAAVATLLSYIALVSVETQFLSKSIKISVPTEQIGWYCLSAGIMAALIFAAKQTYVSVERIQLLILLTSAVLVYLLLVILHPDVRGEMHSILRGESFTEN